MDDSGKRITYGENMAIREPTRGNERYDLMTTIGIDRLTQWN